MKPDSAAGGTLNTDLIAAVATAPGQGGIGVIRVSGPGAAEIALKVCGRLLKPRFASLCNFCDGEEVIDQGIALLFSAQASFTGEEVVEFQGHGGPVVLQRLLSLVCQLGARLALPGEFSERAFLNGKIDLAQAEAIADLISSTSVAAAKAAVNSLRGVFSEQINELAENMAKLRILVEACIDFPDEDVDFLEDGQVATRIEGMQRSLIELREKSAQGRLINEGINVALIGAPNAGKSSLLNVLAGEEAAIVTDIPGTTRDLLKVDMVLNGLPIRLVDTAGLRETIDEVEKHGVARARHQAQRAELILLVLDASTDTDIDTATQTLLGNLDYQAEVIVVVNKVDLLITTSTRLDYVSGIGPVIYVSATNGTGLTELSHLLGKQMGLTSQEAGFIARARHLAALDDALVALEQANLTLAQGDATEIVAEELKRAHESLGEIVGRVTPDDLLGRIFSEFCIGK